MNAEKRIAQIATRLGLSERELYERILPSALIHKTHHYANGKHEEKLVLDLPQLRRNIRAVAQQRAAYIQSGNHAVQKGTLK